MVAHHVPTTSRPGRCAGRNAPVPFLFLLYFRCLFLLYLPSQQGARFIARTRLYQILFLHLVASAFPLLPYFPTLEKKREKKIWTNALWSCLSDGSGYLYWLLDATKDRAKQPHPAQRRIKLENNPPRCRSWCAPRRDVGIGALDPWTPRSDA